MTGIRRRTGWKLDGGEREALLGRFQPAWPDVIADHVTYKGPGAPEPKTGEIVGRVNDGEGLEALVVRIDGTTDRPDGGTWHISWSLDRAQGREPKQSNDVLAAQGWDAIEPPVPVRLIPGEI